MPKANKSTKEKFKPRVGLIQTTSNGKKEVKASAGGMDLSGILGSEADVSSILLEAERIIPLVADNTYPIGRLDDRKKAVLYIYFYVSNPIIRRIINLHTNLPLSSLTLQKPKVENDIIQDYVFQYFQNMMSEVKWKKWVTNAIITFWIFGRSNSLVEDDFMHEKEVAIDDDIFDQTYIPITKEKKEKIKEITDRYNEDKDDLTDEDLNYVIENFIINANPNYKGIKRIKLISPFDIESLESNDDINFNNYTLKKSEYVSAYVNQGKTEEDKEVKIKELVKIGYTRSFVEANIKDGHSDCYEVTNDPFSEDGLYMAEFGDLDICGINGGFMSSVLPDLIKYHQAHLKENDVLNLVNQKVNIISPEGEEIGGEIMAELESKMNEAIQNSEGSVVTANFPISHTEVDFTTKDNLEVSDKKEDSVQKIIIGSGIPESMLTAQDSYGGSFLKMEVLNQEYVVFRQLIKEFIEEQIFKPIAIKRGFFYVDRFGYVQAIYPKVNFEVGTIINSSEFRSLLKDMVDDGWLSKARYLEYIGFDPEEERAAIKREKERDEEAGIDTDI